MSSMLILVASAAVGAWGSVLPVQHLGLANLCGQCSTWSMLICVASAALGAWAGAVRWGLWRCGALALDLGVSSVVGWLPNTIYRQIYIQCSIQCSMSTDSTASTVSTARGAEQLSTQVSTRRAVVGGFRTLPRRAPTTFTAAEPLQRCPYSRARAA